MQVLVRILLPALLCLHEHCGRRHSLHRQELHRRELSAEIVGLKELTWLNKKKTCNWADVSNVKVKMLGGLLKMVVCQVM